MKNKSTAWGIVLIVIAIYYLLSKLGYIPEELSTFKIILTIVFLFTAAQGIMEHSFTEFLLSLALIASVHAKLLHITEITPFPLAVTALLIGIGLDLIFKKSRKNQNTAKIHREFKNAHIENIMDGDEIRVKNHFGVLSKYVNSNRFQRAEINSCFGSCNVYFNNAILGTGNAEIIATNSFGELNLYFPNTWRVNVKEHTAFGDIKFRGIGSSDKDAPCVFINADCSFGQITICFE